VVRRQLRVVVVDQPPPGTRFETCYHGSRDLVPSGCPHKEEATR
jgi:hypothetical protein